MPRIVKAVGELFTERREHIVALLSALRSVRPLHCDVFKGPVGAGKAFYAHDGLGQQPTHRDYPFRLKGCLLDCKYFEIWRPVSPDAEDWFLTSVNLSVLRRNKEKPLLDEIVCVHCEPETIVPNPAGRHKRGPHLHVERAEYPLMRCHFPLCITNLDNVLHSPAAFDDALAMFVETINDEVVDRYRKQDGTCPSDATG